MKSEKVRTESIELADGSVQSTVSAHIPDHGIKVTKRSVSYVSLSDIAHDPEHQQQDYVVQTITLKSGDNVQVCRRSIDSGFEDFMAQSPSHDLERTGLNRTVSRMSSVSSTTSDCSSSGSISLQKPYTSYFAMSVNEGDGEGEGCDDSYLQGEGHPTNLQSSPAVQPPRWLPSLFSRRQWRTQRIRLKSGEMRTVGRISEEEEEAAERRLLQRAMSAPAGYGGAYDGGYDRPTYVSMTATHIAGTDGGGKSYMKYMIVPVSLEWLRMFYVRYSGGGQHLTTFHYSTIYLCGPLL